MNAQTVNAMLFQLILDKKLDVLLEPLSPNEIRSYLDKLSNPDFGKYGNYSFFCKNCGGSWSFKSKKEKLFFEQFHKYSHCSIEFNSKDGVNRGIRNKNSNISELGTSQVKAILNQREELHEEKIKDAVQSEPEAVEC